METLKINFIFSLLLIVTACATREHSGSVFTENESKKYQTPPFSLESYKSPELRSMQQQKGVSVAVSISGGGHRAGNFGVGALKALENISCGSKNYNVLKEVDYFSTVSGGGLAAGVYISTLYDYHAANNGHEYSLSTIIEKNKFDIRNNLERGYHDVLTDALVRVETIGNRDRGDFLEEEFDRRLLGFDIRKKSIELKDVFVPKDAVSNPVLPMWVTNATIYENGSIFPFHPDALKRYKVTTYTHHKDKKDVNRDYYNFPLSVGLKASASFPGAVPATTLKSSYDTKNKYIHLFDGGLSDNLGVHSAFSMLEYTGENEKILIIIDAYNGQAEPFSKKEGSPTAAQIGLRTTDIYLDAWRIHHRKVIEQLSSSKVYNGKSVKVVYLTFEDSPDDIKDKAKDIGTNFKISDKDQDVLFKAAQFSVDENREQLIQAVFEESCEQHI